MKVKEILAYASEFIGEREIAKKLASSETETFSNREQEKVDALLRCFNFVNEEIASDYLPYLTREEINVDNSILNFSSLSKTLINIYSIKGRFHNVRYRQYPDYVQIFGKAKEIVYSFLPDKHELDDEFEFYNGLSARIFAYGVASEYFLIDGLSEDAEIWEERFKESLFVLSRKKSETKLPKRKWF